MKRRRDKLAGIVTAVWYDVARMATGLEQVRIISFDAEGTLASHAFSRAIWQEIVPRMYGEKHGIPFEQAAEKVFAQYHTIGPNRREWYDIGYWFHRLDLGEALPVIEAHRSLIEYYPESRPVLDALCGRYQLVVASSTPLEFLGPLLRDVEGAFDRYFSATSALGRLKDEEFFRWMGREMGVDPSEVLHVGDSWDHDFVSSSDAGMRALYLDRSGGKDHSLHSLLDLVAVLDGAHMKKFHSWT